MRARLATLAVSIAIFLSWAVPASSSTVLVDPEIAAVDALYERAFCPSVADSVVQEIRKIALDEDRKSWVRQHAVKRLGELARKGGKGLRQVLEGIASDAQRSSSLRPLGDLADLELARLDLSLLGCEEKRVNFLRGLVVEPGQKYQGTSVPSWAAEELCARGDNEEIEYMTQALRSLSVSGSEEAVSLCLKQIELVQGAKNRVEAWVRALELEDPRDVPLADLQKWAIRELVSHKGRRSEQVLLVLGTGRFGEHLSDARRVEALRELKGRGLQFEELESKGADPRLLLKAGLAPAAIMKQLNASKTDPCAGPDDNHDAGERPEGL